MQFQDIETLRLKLSYNVNAAVKHIYIGTHFSRFPSMVTLWTFPTVRKFIVHHPRSIVYLKRQQNVWLMWETFGHRTICTFFFFYQRTWQKGKWKWLLCQFSTSYPWTECAENKWTYYTMTSALLVKAPTFERCFKNTEHILLLLSLG